LEEYIDRLVSFKVQNVRIVGKIVV